MKDKFFNDKFSNLVNEGLRLTYLSYRRDTEDVGP